MTYCHFEFKENCEKLPEMYPLTDISNNYNKYINSAKQFFNKDLKNILVNNRRLIIRDDDFEHVITRKTKNLYGKQERLTTYNRVQRISWIKYLLTICYTEQCDNIKEWVKLEPKRKRNRLHIMCDKVGYLIILEEYKNIYFIVTAFCIDNNYHDYYLEEYNKYGKN